MNTVKCIDCVNARLGGKRITPESVQSALDGARLAVVTTEGKSVCADHYYRHLTAKVGEYVSIMGYGKES